MMNKNKIKEQLGCDDNFLSQLIDTFVKDSQISCNLMKNALIEENWSVVGGYAHKTLSSTRIFELHELSKNLETIEDYAKNEKNLDQIPELVDRYSTQLNETIKELKST